MNTKAMVTGVAVTAVGVIVAGYLMSALRGTSVIDKAHDGFDS
ncbi:hypothetical protein [Oceanibaculum indicum]|uniref:Uncharacterized protein n=1 Tax=Oceanibaculum indicum TaxID=526216 RepID=A0A420WPY1_9PROT|nr:hypothetical protein [Oceanibaculum indicum]RKQ73103.1 hypothetical protein BCL74_0876 [Oceanibaculum indicum]